MRNELIEDGLQVISAVATASYAINGILSSTSIRETGCVQGPQAEIRAQSQA